MTLAQRFMDKARELVPSQDDLQNIEPSLDNAQLIDEAIFSRSEYLGGMATVILALLKQEDCANSGPK